MKTIMYVALFLNIVGLVIAAIEGTSPSPWTIVGAVSSLAYLVIDNDNEN